jgi:hypothetical protein
MSPGIDGHQDSSTHQSRPSTGRLRPCACGSALSCRVCSPAGPRRSLLSPLEERETTVRRSPHSLDTGGVTDTHTRWLCRSTDRPWGWLNRTSLFYWKKKKAYRRIQRLLWLLSYSLCQTPPGSRCAVSKLKLQKVKSSSLARGQTAGRTRSCGFGSKCMNKQVCKVQWPSSLVYVFGARGSLYLFYWGAIGIRAQTHMAEQAADLWT